MARIKQTRNPEISVFQSAIDAVVMRDKVGGGAQALGEAVHSQERAGIEDPMVHQAAAFAHAVDITEDQDVDSVIPDQPPVNPVTAEGIGDIAKYCAGISFKLAKAIFLGNKADEQKYRDELTAKFGSCDARYVEAAEQAALYFGMQKGVIPYVDYQSLSDYVIEDKTILPDNAKVGVIGDWGTGQSHAVSVLQCLATHDPDVVIHLGDIYYAGIDFEVQGYFFEKWCQTLKLDFNPETRRVTTARPRTFTLAGNHDMYSGGAPYYQVIQQLGQRASFFCLRNDNWQFIGMDTGYNDHDLSKDHFTSLPDRQPEWIRDKITSRGNRRTILLSHHQLFSANDSFQNQGDTNTALLGQVKDMLGNVDLWLWGHEHDLSIFQAFQGLARGRCMGHGAYPVGFDEIPGQAVHQNVPREKVFLPRGKSFFNNGYAIVQLNGSKAHVQYMVVDDNGKASELFSEDL